MEIRSQFFRMSAMLLLATVTTSCSWLTGDNGMFRDRQGDYLVSPVVPPLQVPPELDSFTLEENFPIPPRESVRGGDFLTPPPPRELDFRVREGVVIQRFGDRRWILIGATPGQVWPRLRDFWATARIPVVSENPVLGTMETDWLTADSGREKYRVRIEPGLHAGNSEIYVVQVYEATLGGGDIQSIMQSHNLDRENEMLTAVSGYLAERTDLYRASSVSLLAGSIEIESKARVGRGAAGELVLDLRIDYSRAWGQVGQSLNSVPGATILDSNQEEGWFTVSFTGAEPEDKPGFFRRMFRRDNSGTQVSTHTVRLSREGEQMVVVSIARSAMGEFESQRSDELIQAISDNLN
jgi:outer membrane protein assembly factor BamC